MIANSQKRKQQTKPRIQKLALTDSNFNDIHELAIADHFYMWLRFLLFYTAKHVLIFISKKKINLHFALRTLQLIIIDGYESF